jgi:hypothetical protein
MPEQGQIDCWKKLVLLFVCISEDSSQPSVQSAPDLEWSPVGSVC